MPNTSLNETDEWLRRLGVSAAPLTRQGLATARAYFAVYMPDLSEKDQLSYIAGMDLHNPVSETPLDHGDTLAAFRYRTENPLRLFYTKPGASPVTLGVKPTGRVFRRFKVRHRTLALQSRCVSVRTIWTDDPRYVANGGGIQFIVPNAGANLVAIANEAPERRVRDLHMSSLGAAFLFRREAQPHVSNHLHWPGGASGVTLGPGYDMKERSAATISADMVRIGLPKATADKVAGGARLIGHGAKEFAHANVKLVTLTGDQETALLQIILPHYESIVHRNVTVPLRQYEFDALVSFVYNPGGSFVPVATAINTGHTARAMAIMQERVISGHTRSQGLANRRAYEVTLFSSGDYGR